MPGIDQEWGERWFEEVWNRQRRSAIGEMIAPEAQIHEAGTTVLGPDGFYPFFDRMQAAFTQIHVTVEDTIAQADKICIRWSCQMKHTGQGLGMAPSGKVLQTTGITIVRISEGKAIEAWQNWDMLGLMHQIEGQRGSPTYMNATC